MIFKKVIIFQLLLVSFISFSQDRLNHNWRFGIGGGLIRYSNEDASFIGDRTASQLPRFNVTRKITDKISLDLATSFGNFDSSVFTNNTAPYVSIDLSARYRYIDLYEKFDPYVFLGSSYVDETVEKGASVTANIGTGATYWLGRVIALNGQVYYKHAFETEKIRSHPQVTFGIIFGLGDGSKSRNGSARCYYFPKRSKTPSNVGRCYYEN